MIDGRTKRPSVEIASSISDLKLLTDTIGGMMMMYEHLTVRVALLHSFADTFINVRGLDKELLISKNNKEHVANKRHELIWYFRKMGFPAKEIGAYFKRTQYAVTYAYNKQEKIYQQHKDLQDEQRDDKKPEESGAIEGDGDRERCAITTTEHLEGSN